MSSQAITSTHRTDQMVFIGLGLAAAYWVLEAVLYVMLSGNMSFFQRLVSHNIDDVALRMLVLCFFMIFGSHAQYTISQRKQVEDALKDSEEKYRTIIESIEDGYYELDLLGSFTFYNHAMRRLLGYERDEMAGTSIRRIMDAENFHKIFQIFDTVRQEADKGTKTFEGEIMRKDGSRRYVEASVSLIKDKKGEAVGYRGLFRDTTERKEAELLSQAKMAAEAANRSKSEFLANMSHEIRTPLNSITGLVELLLETELTREQKEDLEVVMSASYSLLAVINDILDFSKIEAGKLELEQNPFIVRDFLDETLRILSIKAHEKNLELAYRVSADVPDQIIGDYSRFRQILLNLVGNAIKFTSEGEIVVSVACEQLSETEVMLHFSVKDTGIGIPKDKQESIFSPFQQADGSTTRRYGGTGLGLAVSSQLVDLMNGRIWLESEPGWGSIFHFTARTAFIPGSAKPVDPGIDVKKLNVLVVDDNTTSRRIIQELLESWNISSVTASNASEARHMLTASKDSNAQITLAVVDSELPDSGSIDLVQWINSRKEEPVGIILTTTRSSSRDRSDFKALNIHSAVVKPIRPSDLLDAVLAAAGLQGGQDKHPERRSSRKTEPAPKPLRILVAEDTPFNQKFILRLLGKLGHQVTIAENGRLALEYVFRDEFDLVLMDVQMPELDGLAATREIRSREKDLGGHIPIIAMTAHAMKGDRELCLEAGMDGYVSKPISTEILFNTIQKLLPENTRSGPEERMEKAGSSLPDKDQLLGEFDQDQDFLKEIVRIFLADAPPMVDTLKKALQTKDADLLRRTAHSLKGMLGNFQAEEAARTASELEEFGRRNVFDNLEELCEKLAGQLDEIYRVLTEM